MNIQKPLFIDKGNIKRVSDQCTEWGNIVKKDLHPKTYYIKQ